MSTLSRSLLIVFLSWPLASAAGTEADIANAIRDQNWPVVSRQALVRAAAIDSSGLSVVRAMAATGMMEEATAAAMQSSPPSRSALLLDIAGPGLNLPASAKAQIAGLALKQAALPGVPASIATANLARVALLLNDLGDDSRARSTFAAAISLARSQPPAELHQDAMRSVADVLGNGSARKVPEWMLFALAAQLSNIPNAYDRAISHTAMAQGYFKLGRAVEARGQLDLALSAAADVPRGALRQTAIAALTQVAAKNGEIAFARRYGNERDLAPELAVFHARSGNRVQALAQIAKTGRDTLYISHRQAAGVRIIREALDRKDLSAALFYATEFDDLPEIYRVAAWAGVGKLQTESGLVNDARASFQRARGDLSSFSDPYTSARDVRATLDLSLAMHQSGLQASALEIAAAAVRQVAHIHDRRHAERAFAEGQVSEALVRLGNRAEAIRLLALAWSSADALPEDTVSRRLEKAEALSQLAMAAHGLGDMRSTAKKKTSPVRK